MARKRRLNAEPRRTAKRQPTRARKPQKEHAARPQRAEPAAAAPTKPAVAAPMEPSAAVNPFAPMERLMQAFMPMSMAWLRPWLTEPQAPKLDVIDRNGALIVRAEVPGIDKNDVDSARAKATFKDGVLEVLLPKIDRARPHPLKL